MKRTALLALLAVTSPVLAQGPPEKQWGIEASVGPGQTLEGFTSDCCGPTRKQSGPSISARLLRRVGPHVEVGADAGANLVRGRDMQWAMLAGSLTGAARLAPSLRLGVGAVRQRGDCPVDGSAFSRHCGTSLRPGGQVALGARWSLGAGIAVGLEAGLVRGLTQSDHHFTSRQISGTLRWLW